MIAYATSRVIKIKIAEIWNPACRACASISISHANGTVEFLIRID